MGMGLGYFSYSAQATNQEDNVKTRLELIKLCDPERGSLKPSHKNVSTFLCCMGFPQKTKFKNSKPQNNKTPDVKCTFKYYSV